MAKALGRSLPVSFKHSVELCSFIRGKKYESAVSMLERVVKVKQPVPFRRYMRGGVGHRPGMAAGRYPTKAAAQVLTILKSAHANATNVGLNGELVVKAAVARQGPRTPHYGRKRGTTAKRTHIEIVLEQIAEKPVVKKKASVKKKAAKQEVVETKTQPEVKKPAVQKTAEKSVAEKTQQKETAPTEKSESKKETAKSKPQTPVTQ